MRLSEYFLPVLKENPSEAKVTSHLLMLRAGMIRQQSSGLYSWLPLGLKVLKNIEEIVRFNMHTVGGIELLMPCIQPSDLWLESGRYDDYGKEMLRIKDRHDNDLLFGPTNEEVITDIFRNNIKSYKDLPKNLYHIQWKFRDEIRPRFGVMRGREFLMKDAYTFDIDEESAIKSYNRMYLAYIQIFRDLGVPAIPVQAESGAIGGNLSHEFHIIADTGESAIYYDKKFKILAEDSVLNLDLLRSLYAAADEKHDPKTCPITGDALVSRRGIEVGHIFYFGTKYSKPMNASVTNARGELVNVEMGAYGVGISRLVAAIIEASHDEKGIVWPDSVAPFKVSILNLDVNNSLCKSASEEIYQTFCYHNIDILYDDTDARPGQKFATHDLIGSPWQIIVGSKNISTGMVELKHRKTGEVDMLDPMVAVKKILGSFNVA